MSEPDNYTAKSEGQDWDSYVARYCETCGQLYGGSEKITTAVEEPVHRMDLIEAIGPMHEVRETVAIEERQCECTGQIVKRWYVHPVSNVPEPDRKANSGQSLGRDATEDGWLALSNDPDAVDYRELRELSWITGGTEVTSDE